MSAFAAIGAVSPVTVDPIVTQIGGIAAPGPAVAAPGGGFGDILSAGIQSVDAKLASADALVRRFALDDSVPVHQVTFALEEARLSVELAMQVRARLVEGYRDIMNMQL